MTPLTAPAEHTIYRLAAELMEAAPGYGDCSRIDRALDLVSGVERTAFPTVYLVRSASDENRDYTVRNTLCNCADTPRARGATHCKHEWAVILSNLLERAEVDAEQDDTEDDDTRPDVDDDAGDEAFPWEREPACAIHVAADESILDLWPGEPCDLPAQCSRCHAEETNRRHPDGLGDACIRRELFGEEV